MDSDGTISARHCAELGRRIVWRAHDTRFLYGVTFSVSDGVDTITRALFFSVYAVNIATSGVLPNATLNVPYSTSHSKRRDGPYVFSTAFGLPTGLTLSPSGTISGTLAFTGKNWLIITVKDSTNASYEKAFSLDAIGVPPVLPLISASYYTNGGIGNIDDCTIGVVCNRGIGVLNGGAAPFTWLVSGLPPGVSARLGSGIASKFVASGPFSSVHTSSQGTLNYGVCPPPPERSASP